MVLLARQIVLLNSCHFQQVDRKDASFVRVRVGRGGLSSAMENGLIVVVK